MKKSNGPFFLFIFFILIAAATAGLLWKQSKKADHVRKEKKAARSAARKELVESSHDQSLQKFSLTGFDNSGKKFWNLEGETAKIDPGQTIFLDQNVTLKLQDSTIVKTDHVQWSPDGDTLRTAAPVFVDSRNTKIKGMGVYGRPNENFIQINKDIEMLIYPDTTITCAGPMKIFYNKNTMVFYRNVKVKDNRGVLKANRMDVFFDEENKKVNQVVAAGKVVIERGSDTTKSNRATYVLSTGAIRLEGNPEVTVHKEGPKVFNGITRN